MAHSSAFSFLGKECPLCNYSWGREKPQGSLSWIPAESACVCFPYVLAVYPYYVAVINLSCEFNSMLSPSESPKMGVVLGIPGTQGYGDR